jgi:integrase/recombinase XerD
VTALAPRFRRSSPTGWPASPHTIAAYRDTWRLLLGYASQRCGGPAARLDLADLDAPLIGAFLDHLEHDRGNSQRTRNARLAAIHSLFRHAALRHPEHAGLIARVLAIPPKRYDKALVTWLTEPELAVLLADPDRSSWAGRRDHALILLAAQTGLRISELTGLTAGDVHLGTGPHVSCRARGAKPDHPAHHDHGRGGWPNAAVSQNSRCSPAGPVGGSAATPSSTGSPSTPPLRRNAVPPCTPRLSRRTRFVIQRP